MMFFIMFLIVLFSVFVLAPFLISIMIGISETTERKKARRKFLDTFSPEKLITKKNLKTRKHDLQFLISIIKSNGSVIYSEKAQIEDLLVINGVLKESLRRGVLKISERPFKIDIDLFRELAMQWHQYIEKLENEMLLESEIDDLLENEIKAVAKNNKKKVAAQQQVQAEV